MPHEGRFDAGRRATRPPSTAVKFTAKTDLPAITAVRLELLTDPNLPARRSGPLDPGPRRAHRVRQWRPHPQPIPDKFEKIKIRERHRRLRTCRRRALEPKFDDKSEEAARDRPDRDSRSTARTRPRGASTPGPACAIRRARPSSSLEKPVGYPRRYDSALSTSNRTTAALTRTITRTTTWAASGSPSPSDPDAAADPVPAGVREILAVPAAQRTSAQDERRLLATGAPPFPNGRRTTTRSQTLWREHPEGSPQLVLTAIASDDIARRTC